MKERAKISRYRKRFKQENGELVQLGMPEIMVVQGRRAKGDTVALNPK